MRPSRLLVRVCPYTLSVAALLASVTCAPSAFAQADVDRATARTLGQDGEKALEAKDFKTAEDDFRRADSLVHAPTLLLGLARALVGEGKLVDAQETYKRIVREGVAPSAPPVFHKAVEDASKEVQDVSPRIGAVTISVTAAGGAAVPGLQVTMDGVPVNTAALGVRRPADPGAHAVKASATGYKTAELKINVPVGGPVDAPLTLEVDTSAATAPGASPATAPPPATAPATTAPAATADQTPSAGGGRSLLPWVAFGVGGIGLIAGGVTGALAIGKHSDLSSHCSSGTCNSSEQSDLDSYHTLGLVSTIGFVVAGVGAAAGVTLLLIQPKGDAPPATGLHVVPIVGPGSVGATGTF